VTTGGVPSLRQHPRRLRCGNLELVPGSLQLFADGRPVPLTAREFQLLVALAERRNRVVPRSQLYELVWRRPMAYRERSVDVFVRKLRLKLHAASPGWEYIHTHFGVGYRFAPERVRQPVGERVGGPVGEGVGGSIREGVMTPLHDPVASA
jgi:DNA-binding response OmpR family regulator